jgi:hypothetical protein
VISIDRKGGGRGNPPVVSLSFVERGPKVECQINAPLFEAVLSHRRSG